MKAGKKDEELVKVAYRLPKIVCNCLEESAIKNRHSINDELITILEDYFNSDLVKLDPTIKNAVEKFANVHSQTVTGATNYLVATKINVMEWVHDIGKEEANKEYDTEFSERKKENAV
jgi:hypothetical protein